MRTLARSQAKAPHSGIAGTYVAGVDAVGASLEVARLRDAVRRETIAARFRRPVAWVGACHRVAGVLARGSLSMAGRMLCVLVIVLLVSPYVVNEPFDITYGLQAPPPPFLRDYGDSWGPRSVDLLRNIPTQLAPLFVVLAVLFASTAVLGIILREATGLGLRLLRRWARRMGVEVTTPGP